MANDSPHTQDTAPKRVVMHYIKSPMFRTIHADGLIGGVTPHQNIHMSFWNERSPIPQLIEHEIGPDGTLGKEILDARIGKKGLLREVDVDVIMDLGTAIAVRKWLDDKIHTLEQALEKQEKKVNE